MKNLLKIILVLSPILGFSQVTDNFSDGNFTLNPLWTGTTANFIVNSSNILQSNAQTTSSSYLFTPSQAIDNATWELWVKINYNTSSSNYASFYIVSDRNDLTSGCNGYYVKIGDTSDNISLWMQDGTTKTKIIDGNINHTNTSSNELTVRVTRDSEGNFKLYSKSASNTDFILEGETTNTNFLLCKYVGLFFSNTTSTGKDYFFDNITVTGDLHPDTQAPIWKKLTLISPTQLKLDFSEGMNFSEATYSMDNGIGSPSSTIISDDATSITLTFDNALQKGILYQLTIDKLTDFATNILPTESRNVCIIESKGQDDLIINEIMFDNPTNSTEYVEVFNRSKKILDLSGMILTTYKSDGSYNTGIKIPANVIILPDNYIAFCDNSDLVNTFHHPPVQSKLITAAWQNLNNESDTILLINATKDTIFDKVAYSSKWHHILIKNTKGVALEKVNPYLSGLDALSWHSGASETNYGTPGYKNAQFREIKSTNNDEEKWVWSDPEVFSPNNDGNSDICFIRYRTPENGYVANVTIFTPSGEILRRLQKNVLLSTQGYFIWDGLTDKGLNVNAGIYVLFFEMANPKNGEKKQTKLPIVISSI